jgi:hypothetical protein
LIAQRRRHCDSGAIAAHRGELLRDHHIFRAHRQPVFRRSRQRKQAILRILIIADERRAAAHARDARHFANLRHGR